MQHQPDQHFLQFTKKEKHGVLFLLLIVILLNVIPGLYSRLMPVDVVSDSAFLKDIARLKEIKEDSTPRYQKLFSQTSNYEKGSFESEVPESTRLFNFDPNTLSVEGWQALGVNARITKTILNYSAKGGRFKEPADLKKIWGLPADLAERLIPLVKIPPRDPKEKKAFSSNDKPFQKKLPASVELNSTDSAALDALPGIGGGYARRILKFRERLGGFINADQVAETFGLPDSVFQKIRPFLKVNGDGIRKINLNQATLDELKAHPYIRYQLANAILQFRTQHGPFSDIADLKKIMIISEEIYLKMRPYVTL